jgi:hypothetical protein
MFLSRSEKASSNTFRKIQLPIPKNQLSVPENQLPEPKNIKSSSQKTVRLEYVNDEITKPVPRSAGALTEEENKTLKD